MRQQKKTEAPLLSKWWMTASAKASMERAKLRKQESLRKFLEARKAKQEALKREVEEWEVVA